VFAVKNYEIPEKQKMDFLSFSWVTGYGLGYHGEGEGKAVKT
jgi:hypothetical protein